MVELGEWRKFNSLTDVTLNVPQLYQICHYYLCGNHEVIVAFVSKIEYLWW